MIDGSMVSITVMQLRLNMQGICTELNTRYHFYNKPYDCVVLHLKGNIEANLENTLN